MVTKAKPEDVMKLGFTFEMFRPTVAEEGEFTPFIQSVLDDNVAEVKALIGASVYDDAAKVSDVKRLEVYLAAAELWERKGNMVLRDRVVSGDNSVNITESIKAEEYREKARAIVQRVQSSGGSSGFASSVEESSHFPQDSTT